MAEAFEPAPSGAALRSCELSQDRLRELLEYDPETGKFRNRIRRANSAIGTVVGCLDSNGYVMIRVDYRLYRAHQLAFLYMTRSIPDRIDHRNENKSDNRWVNLRAATNSQNMMNVSALPRNNTSGVRGVSWHKGAGKWFAQIKAKGRNHYLGLFEDFDAAVKARRSAERIYFREFAPH